MKKFILILFVISCAGLTVKAQDFGFKKGDFLVEATLSAAVDEGGLENYDRTSSFGFHPQVSYFLSDKWAVGVGLGVGNGKYDVKQNATSFSADYDYFTVGVFGRYYFLDLGSRFKTFAAVGSSFQKNSHSFSNDYSIPGDTKNFYTQGGIGANFFITKNISIAYTFSNIIGFNVANYGDGLTSTQFSLALNEFSNFFNSGTFSLGFNF